MRRASLLISTLNLSQNEVLNCLMSSSVLQQYYVDLFRWAEPMYILRARPQMRYHRETLGEEPGEEDESGRGISNIHLRQLFMNIKAQLWAQAGSHHFLFSLSSSMKTSKLNAFINFWLIFYSLLPSFIWRKPSVQRNSVSSGDERQKDHLCLAALPVC